MFEPWAEGDRDVEVHNHFTVDAVRGFLIPHQVAARSFKEDGFIGWDDLIHGGDPAYADTMSTYGDWTTQLHRFLSFWTAWHIGLAVQFLIAGLGMFVFLRSRRIGPGIALVGAIAFAANSQFVVWIYHRFQLGGFCWAPWMLWAMCAHRDGKRWAWPLVPVFTALALLGGTLQTNVYVALLLVAVWIGWAWESRHDRRRLLEASWSIGLWGFFGLGLAAFQIFPTAAVLSESTASGMGYFGYTHGVVEPLLSGVFFIGQIFPSLFGSPQSVDLSKALGRDLFNIAFFGFLPMIVAIRSLFLREAPVGARSLVLFGALIPLTPFVGSVYHRVQLLFVIGGIWVFAWYWENYRDDRERALYRWLSWTLAILAGIWLLLSIASWLREAQLVAFAQNELLTRMTQGEGQFRVFEDWMLQRAERLVHELRIWHPGQYVPLIAAFAGLFAIRLRFGRLARYAMPLVLVAVIAELATFGVKWVSVTDSEKYPFYQETADISTLRRLVGPGRVYVVELPDRPGLLPMYTLTMYGVATIQQRSRIVPLNMWQEAGFGTDARTLGRLAVTHAVTYADVEIEGEGWTLQYLGDRLSVWENQFAVPKYMVLVAGDDLFVGETSLRPSGARPIMATPNRRLVEVPAGTAAIRVAENWSEGWQFRVEGGHWRSIRRAPDRSMIIDLSDESTSRTRIEMRYRPQRRIVGRWLSLTTVALLVLFIGFSHRSGFLFGRIQQR
ncbi:MAG: hypothetical protein KAI97_02445, partial [Gemmatimonadetes bacterium]|nr:hypothetical protein [Gemmatimonadota bacterium]